MKKRLNEFNSVIREKIITQFMVTVGILLVAGIFSLVTKNATLLGLGGAICLGIIYSIWKFYKIGQQDAFIVLELRVKSVRKCGYRRQNVELILESKDGRIFKMVLDVRKDKYKVGSDLLVHVDASEQMHSMNDITIIPTYIAILGASRT